MTDTTAPDIVNQLAKRCWTLNHQLRLAGVSQADQDLLFIEVSYEEARAIVTALPGTRVDAMFNVKEPGPDANGFEWTHLQRLTDPMPRALHMPERGRPWLSWYGVRLMWLGD